jgi:hypothetical protein
MALRAVTRMTGVSRTTIQKLLLEIAVRQSRRELKNTFGILVI